jgi:hypothetical protein
LQARRRLRLGHAHAFKVVVGDPEKMVPVDTETLPGKPLFATGTGIPVNRALEFTVGTPAKTEFEVTVGIPANSVLVVGTPEKIVPDPSEGVPERNAVDVTPGTPVNALAPTCGAPANEDPPLRTGIPPKLALEVVVADDEV